MRKRFWRRALLAALCLLLTASAAAETWMYAVSAGKADAILLGGDGWAALVDAGYARSRGKILAAMRQMGVTRLDAVFLTHTDRDHAEGLEWLAESEIEVGAWYASAMFMGVKEKKHPAVQAARARNQEVVWLRAGDSVPLENAVFSVLAPSEPASDKDNNNSLVMMLESADGRVLLAGDMELPEEEILLGSGADLSCDVLKTANHGDDDANSEAFLRAAAPEIAVFSTSSAEKPGTPNPATVAALESLGAQVCVTESCTGGVLTRLSGGETSVEWVNLPEPETGVRIERVEPGADRITLTNDGAADADLSGWMLVSEKGNEWFVLPEGTTIAAGGRLILGTHSTDGAFDLLWDDKKVVHKSKTDLFTLYDANGMTVDAMDNGL